MTTRAQYHLLVKAFVTGGALRITAHFFVATIFFNMDSQWDMGLLIIKTLISLSAFGRRATRLHFFAAYKVSP